MANPGNHSPHTYGTDLALQVARYLLTGKSICYSHRDYCGMGLMFENGMFRYGEVWDGFMIDDTATNWQSTDAFVAWLAAQSDISLSRSNPEEDSFYQYNQCITRERLEQAILF